MQNRLSRVRTKSIQTRKANIFYWVMFALPLLQFLVFYIFANAGSIYLAFFKYIASDDRYELLSASNLFNNFRLCFARISPVLFWNSLGIVGITLTINVVVCLIFSYYLFKNFRFSKFYKLILFLPSIISATVLAIYFSRFVDNCLIPLDWFPIKSLFSEGGNSNNYPLLILFAFFTGFGPTVLVYSNAMGNIPESLLEASELDGASQIRQFFSVIIPYIWPTIVSYVTISIVAFSANQMGLYTFFPGGANVDPSIQNLAYFLFNTLVGEQMSVVPQVAAIGLVLTAIVAPTSIILNKLLTRFGPNEK